MAALDRNPDKPAVYLGDQVLTAREVRDQISRYSQAFAAAGSARAARVAMLSANRPEVLFTMGANMVAGCRTTALHPMGSIDDHAYVLEDAGIETLVFDPTAFGERAAALQERVPGLKHLLALGPTEVGEDLLAAAAGFPAGPLRAARRRPRGRGRPGLHRRHHRQAQGRDGHLPQRRGHDHDPDGRVAVARGDPLPHLHAAQPRRRRVLHPDAAAGRLDRRRCPASTPARCSRPSRSTGSPPRCSCPRCSTSSSTTRSSPRPTCRASRPSTTAPPPCRPPG